MEPTTTPQPETQPEVPQDSAEKPLPTAEDQLRTLEKKLSGTQELQKLEEDRDLLNERRTPDQQQLPAD